MPIDFKSAPSNKKELEQKGPITPKFGADGLITAVAQDSSDGQILMLAHMNAQALAMTIETGIAHYYSRSRQSLWKKGETSGNIQTVHDIFIDCDQDAVVLSVSVEGDGTACHTNRKTCFYRKVDGLGSNEPTLIMNE